MALLSFGSEACSYTLPAGSVYAHSTDTTRFDSAVTRVAMVVQNGVSELILPFDQVGGISEVYIRAKLYQESVAAGIYFDIQNEAGTQTQYRVELDATGQWIVKRFDGTNFITLGTTSQPMSVNELITFDLYIKRDAALGSIEVRRNNVQVLIVNNVDTSTPATMGQLRLIGLAGATQKSYWSEVMVTDTSAYNERLVTLAAIADGAQTGWIGDYTKIDEAVYNSADFVETNTVGLVQTYAHSGIPAGFSTYNVKAVGVASRVSNDSGSAVNDAQHVVRVGNTDYTTTNLGIVKDGSEQSIRSIFLTNPNTAAPWTFADVNTTEFGIKSV